MAKIKLAWFNLSSSIALGSYIDGVSTSPEYYKKDFDPELIR